MPSSNHRSTPRPTPKFFLEPQTFSTKKERGTPRESLPPRPPIKSCPPVSRIFPQRLSQRAQVVSFRESENSTGLVSPLYNQSSKALYFSQCFEIVSKLGAGSFGEVFKVRSKEDGKFYAIKRSRDRFKGKSDRKRKLEEVAKQEQLPKHNNCVGFFKAWEEREHLYLQTELCQTSLNNFAENNHAISETLIWNYLVDLLMAVNHLHTHDLVHMDIKPENIFISKDGVCKLGDFGLVVELSKGDLTDVQEGDPKYLAPEILDGKIGKAGDIFSLGITILELASDLDLPRGGPGWHQLREGHLPEDFLRGMSSDLRSIIKWMMTPDHEERPTAQQVLSDPHVKKIWKRRKRQEIVQSMKDAVVHWFLTVWCFIVFVWSCLIKPIRWMTSFKTTTSSPGSPPGHHGNWDNSFSDDDVFTDESINIHDNSMGSPLDSSGGSDKSDQVVPNSHKETVFAVPSSPARRNSHTTPGQPRHRALCQTPNRSPKMNLFEKFTPESSPSVAGSSRANNPLNSTFIEDEDHKFDIAPKNLMEAFVMGSSDEDETEDE